MGRSIVSAEKFSSVVKKTNKQTKTKENQNESKRSETEEAGPLSEYLF